LTADYGIFVGIGRIKRIRRKLGLRRKQKRKFKATANSNHTLPIAPNLLARDFTVLAPNRAWAGEITSIPTDEGWLSPRGFRWSYLAGIKDLISCELVGYAPNERMAKDLVMQVLFRAVSNQKPKPGLTLHSDRGGQCCAYGYQAKLAQLGMRPSMSRKGLLGVAALGAQFPYGKFLGYIEKWTGAPSPVPNAPSGQTGNYRIHRSFL
jgi:putative transposase